MIYNNLIYFLVVIFVLATDSVPESPRIGALAGFSVSLFLYLVFSYSCARVFRRAGSGASGYFSAEKTLCILAIILFSFLLHFVDLKYYLHPLSLGNRLPVLENIGGLAFFYLLLVIVWLHGRPYYQLVFHRRYPALAFIASNTRANLPIILPWLCLSLAFDLVAWLDLPRIKKMLESPYGDIALFLVFVLFLVLLFPPLVRWLWNCRPMPPSPLREEIVSFCRRQGFSSEILIWPLFEGQVITAGIMGIVPPLRYLLITPALLNTMTREELEAVLAHEIGHVKKKHLILYLFLLLGFSVLAGASAEPLYFQFLASDWFYGLAGHLDISPENLLAFLTGAPFLLLLIIFFRYVFGFFIRNFERQADLHVFQAQGYSFPLISSFEKIAHLGGNIREQKSWHHFGIGERIAFLERCERDRSMIRKHDLKVYSSLAAYLLFIALAALLLGRVDTEGLAADSEVRYVEAIITYKLHAAPDKGLLLLALGDFMQSRKMERKAVESYERALLHNPGLADTYNNLAWLLVTAVDRSLHDPPRALRLALKAVTLREEGYILDTLAVALWANGNREEALAAERKAAERDPRNEEYYRQQAARIAAQDWPDSQ